MIESFASHEMILRKLTKSNDGIMISLDYFEMFWTSENYSKRIFKSLITSSNQWTRKSLEK